MRKMQRVVLASICLFLSPATVYGLVTKLDAKTKEFLAFCESDEQSCVETISTVGQLMMGGNKAHGCKDVTTVTAEDISEVRKWMRSHPEYHERIAVASISAAFQDVWRCRRPE